MKRCSYSILVLFIAASCTKPGHTIIRAGDIPLCSSEELDEYLFIKNELQGVSGFDPEHEDILFVSSEKCERWSPINGRKMQVTGILQDYFIHDGGTLGLGCNDDEFDWNLDIIPTDGFNYIIDDPKQFTEDRSEWKECQLFGITVDCFQGEITPDEHLYDNEWFPKDKTGDEYVSPLEGRKISLYGPWVRDSGHGRRPEIHPCELIWWKESRGNAETFFMFAIQDDSNRFDDNGDFDFIDEESIGFRPWAAFPMTSRFLIPFEYDPNSEFTDHLVLNIEELKHRHIVTEFPDSDNGTNHLLVYDNSPAVNFGGTNKMIEVNENTSNGSHLSIRFVKICKKPDGKIIGYVQITTEYGIKDREEGYHLLKATLTYPSTKPQIKVQK